MMKRTSEKLWRAWVLTAGVIVRRIPQDAAVCQRL